MEDGTSLSPEDKNGAYKILLYDGKRIPFDNKSFDLVVCNSVIEHVPLAMREGLVREIERVGTNYVVQTPAKEFPIEPHFVAPFIHWLLRTLGRAACQLTPRAIMGKGRPATAVFDEVRLLGLRDMRYLFPASRIIVERFLGMSKSYLAIRSSQPARPK